MENLRRAIGLCINKMYFMKEKSLNLPQLKLRINGWYDRIWQNCQSCLSIVLETAKGTKQFKLDPSIFYLQITPERIKRKITKR
ncbi:hypothetical protein GHT06_017587 [Daphnia sinensis]|uniref:Uncharacterized protein n=1 Tax=Daphnia sinensis TaxID=1820382 RepID=A0AAD5KLC9_9CRUS|nr:hypothetical protein GHT06_017587 [Daphnia sinensis]